MWLTMYRNDRPTRYLHRSTFIVTNQCNLIFLILCYCQGAYEVFPSAPQFRKGNNISFIVGLGCVFYVKRKSTLKRLGVKLAKMVVRKGFGGTIIENLNLRYPGLKLVMLESWVHIVKE
jgi:hypothetical protein